MTKEEKNLIDHLLELFDVLNEAIVSLEKNYKICKEIIGKYGFNIGDLDFNAQTSFEALASRFSRISDILVNQIFRVLDELELKEEGSTLDVLNRAEKRGIIESAETFRRIRKARNRITHEYIKKELDEVYKEIFECTEPLIQSYKDTTQYVSKEIIPKLKNNP